MIGGVGNPAPVRSSAKDIRFSRSQKLSTNPIRPALPLRMVEPAPQPFYLPYSELACAGNYAR